jgi:hypothetical protein
MEYVSRALAPPLDRFIDDIYGLEQQPNVLLPKIPSVQVTRHVGTR